MEFIIEAMSADIDISKYSNYMSSVSDISYAYFCESDNAQGFFSKLFFKAVETLQKIYQRILKFFSEIQLAFRIKLEQFSLKKKLADMKGLLAQKKAKAMHKKVDFISVAKYKSYYDKFINMYSKELIRGYNKAFKSPEEYIEWRDGVISKLDEFKVTLNSEEKWKISATINDAVMLSKKEIDNRDSTYKMLKENSTESVKILEDHYKSIPTSQYMRFTAIDANIEKLKSSSIGKFCGSLFACIRTAVSFISKHLLQCIVAVIAALIVL